MRFVEFTRPDGSKIAVAPGWIYLIRPLLPNELPANAVVVISALKQQVMETVAEARALVEKAGAHS